MSVVEDADAPLPLVVVRSASDQEIEQAVERRDDRQHEPVVDERLEYGLVCVRNNRDECDCGRGERAGVCKPDAMLPDDATERELVQVCELVARIVRLRRQSCAARIEAAKYQRLAELDPLTGIANRRAWEAELERAVADCSRRHLPLTVALFDLDEFKQINDRCGMVVGDRVLMEAARELAAASDSSFARPAFVARLGGDEFIVMWVGMTREAARARIDDLRLAIAQGAASSTNFREPRTVSVGWATWRPESESEASGAPDTPLAVRVLAMVDRALREAKLAGRDQCREVSNASTDG